MLRRLTPPASRARRTPAHALSGVKRRRSSISCIDAPLGNLGESRGISGDLDAHLRDRRQLRLRRHVAGRVVRRVEQDGTWLAVTDSLLSSEMRSCGDLISY